MAAMKYGLLVLIVVTTLSATFFMYNGAYWGTEIKVSHRRIRDICGVQGEDSWQNLVVQLQNEILTGRRKGRAVIFQCLPKQTCGGFGDRFRGIVTLFFKAVVEGRAFFIKHEKPVMLEHLLLPKNIFWNVSELGNIDASTEHGIMKTYVNSLPIFTKNGVDVRPEFIHSLNSDDILFLDYISSDQKIPENDIVQTYANSVFVKNDFVKLMKSARMNNETMLDPLLAGIVRGFLTMNFEYTHACVLNFLFAPAPKVVALLEATIVSMMTKHKLKPFVDRIYDGIPLPDEDSQFPWSHVGTGELNIIPISNFFKTPISESEYRPRVTLTDHWRENVADEVLSMMNLTRNTIPPLIGIHFRVSGRAKRKGMSFIDAGSDTPRFDPDALPTVMECADRLKGLMNLEQINTEYILVSDDMTLREDAVEKYDNIISPPLEELPYHVDFPDKPDPDGRRTAETLNELLLLSFSEAVVYTRSGFGRYAARFGMIPLNRTIQILDDLICPV